jgi:WhiB family transcriptional regulator, redox-sensing transcriptional regulator
MASSLVLLTAQAAALDNPLPCRRENPQLWFSDLPADLELAKAYCRPCPMRRVCLAGAVERREPHGVWGGEIFTRGAIIPEKRPRGRPPSKLRPVTGTGAGGIVPPPEMSRETPLSRQPR